MHAPLILHLPVVVLLDIENIDKIVEDDMRLAATTPGLG
jgi:hypothetical protein